MQFTEQKLRFTVRKVDNKAYTFTDDTYKQESQLMLTNPHDTFTLTGQSRSPNIVPFHMLVIVSSCTIVTLTLRLTVIPIFDFKKCHDLEIQVRDHSSSLKVVPLDRLRMISY